MNDNSTVPSVHLLQSLATQRMGWADALGEFIDNSLDAGASEVHVSISESSKRQKVRTLTVKDNGKGIDELHVLVRLGDRKEHTSTKLGRYGIGSKDAAFTIGGSHHHLLVTSTHKGMERTMAFRWSRVIEEGKWLNAEPSDPVPSFSVGTEIKVTPVEKPIPAGKNWNDLAVRLGYMFSPAINSGIVIKLTNGEDSRVLTSYRLPKFDGDFVSVTTEVEGKKLTIKCGLVADGEQNPHPGLTYFHGHRTILGPTADGCGDYLTSRVAGVVQLGSGWQLTKNKDNVNRSADKLFAEVYEHILPILKRAEAIAKSQKSSAFQRRVEGMLNLAAFGANQGVEPDSKAVRGKGETHGTVLPKGTGRRHKNARVIQPGRTFASRAFTTLRIEFVKMDEARLGNWMNNGVVQLNEDHPGVAQAVSTGNAMATALLACHIATHAESARAHLANTLGIDDREEETPSAIYAEFVRRLTDVSPANDSTSNEAAE